MSSSVCSTDSFSFLEVCLGSGRNLLLHLPCLKGGSHNPAGSSGAKQGTTLPAQDPPVPRRGTRPASGTKQGTILPVLKHSQQRSAHSAQQHWARPAVARAEPRCRTGLGRERLRGHHPRSELSSSKVRKLALKSATPLHTPCLVLHTSHPATPNSCCRLHANWRIAVCILRMSSGCHSHTGSSGTMSLLSETTQRH